MAEITFIARMIREYPLKIAILVVNEIISSALVLISVGGLTTILGALLNGDRQLPGLLGSLFGYLGLLNADTLTILFFLVGILLIQVVLESFSKYLVTSTSVSLTLKLRRLLNYALLNVDWVKFSGLDQGRYLQALVVESSLAGGALIHLGSILASGLVTLILLGWMAFTSFEAFVIFATAGAFFLFVIQPVMRRTQRAGEKSIVLSKELNNVATDTRHLFKMLLAENLVPLRINLIDKLINSAAALEIRKQIYAIINSQVLGLETLTVLLLVSVYYLVLSPGNNTDLIVNLLILQRVGTYFATFQNKRHLMIQLIPSYQVCLEIIAKFAGVKQSDRGREQVDDLGDGIQFQDVSYSYSDAPAGVKEISLTLPATGLVFLIGKSGSGKTTLVDILTGLIEPADGKILIGGKNLADLNKAGFARMLTYVPQHAYLFRGTLRENLTFGNADSSDAAIWQALEDADCADLVRKLPAGLETEVNAGGTNFSGGERHRLSLARALMKESKILVLDEPAASVDPQSEEMIFRALQKLAKHILVIVITHSQEVIKDAESIILMAQGRSVWQGSYNQLTQDQKALKILREASDVEQRN